MTFAKPVLLTVQDDHIQRKIFFPKGTHQVPLELCDHWYLKAHGAKKEPRNGE